MSRLLCRYGGKNAKKIQEYIRNQIQEDLEYDQMSLKEYIDPFTGEPVNLGKNKRAQGARTVNVVRLVNFFKRL